jgi:hypothetical protein
LLYLDKSARPLSWLIDDVLSQLHPDIQPHTAYINIGQEKTDDFGWINKRRYKSQHHEWIDRLRAMYQDSSRPGETIFAGSTVWVVDEFTISGSSLFMAERLVKEMTAKDGAPATISTHSLLEHRPVWYDTTGLLGIIDSPDNPFATVPDPSDLSEQFVREIGYLANQMCAT